MKKILCILLFCAAVLPVQAQRRSPGRQGEQPRIDRFLPEEFSGRNRFAWEYDADFQYLFDNREFAYSQDAWIPSGTMNTVVFAPTVGFSVQQDGRVSHRLTAGVEFAHDMGSHVWGDLPREVLLFYDVHVRTRRGVFEGLAGVFPRRYLEGSYGEAFYSGMYRNTDRNLEGVLLKWRLTRLYAELGCDWMGRYGPDTRERFQVMSAGRWQATDWLSLGWTGSFYHYACSEKASNVVDNHLLEPWLKLDFADKTSWQELSLQAGALVGYQCDRAAGLNPLIPAGGEARVTVRRWDVALQNTTYLGDDLMPYFHQLEPTGQPYATNLYFGTPCYDGFFDLLELAWTPTLTRYLNLRLSARAYFNGEGFLGWQQIFSLRFSLDALRHRDTVSGRCL